MNEQPTLRLFHAEPDDANVRELVRLLAEYRGWMSSGLIGSLTGWNSDKVNALARAAAEVISGQLGYKHLSHATTAEKEHFFNAEESRAKRILERVQRVRARAHQMIG